MSMIKYGVKASSWNKHFSKWMKREFWKKVRKAGKKEIIKETGK
jgi:hypothetical protein